MLLTLFGKVSDLGWTRGRSRFLVAVVTRAVDQVEVEEEVDMVNTIRTFKETNLVHLKQGRRYVFTYSFRLL